MKLGSTVFKGAAAAAAGTLAMDLVQYGRYRRGGGEVAAALAD